MGVEHPGSIRENYLATHPSTPERAAAMNEGIEEIAGKLLRTEALVPIKLEESTNETQTAREEKNLERKEGPKPHEQAKLEKERLNRGVKQQPVSEEKPKPVKRFATLYLVGDSLRIRGGSVAASGISIQAEYTDDGSGHGPVRIFYMNNNILEGEYWTVGAGQNFQNVINVSLIDPDKITNFPSNTQKGFASVSGVDGTKLECVYALTSESGKGLGTCVDSQGNQYRLVF